MRKYQQLLLLLISIISIIILVVYRNENNRLKYVLQVVNFFGRNDEIELREQKLVNLTNDNTFNKPLPLWQVIGNNFYAYSAYWNKNELTPGGEAIAIVTGKRDAIVNFRCEAEYDEGARNILGKFHFQRHGVERENVNFINYKFYCRFSRDFGIPQRIAFTDINTNIKTNYKLRLRHLKKSANEVTTLQQSAICVNLINYDMTTYFSKSTANLLQFFLHHHIALSAPAFIVYNSDELSASIISTLQSYGIRLYLVPYNFPFSLNNASASTREIVEADCLLRNYQLSQHTLILNINEFFFPNTKLGDNSVFRSMHHYENEITRFELPTFAVCIGDKNKVLVENKLYDPEVHTPNKIYLYRNSVQQVSFESTRSVSLPVSTALLHHYIVCTNVGKDGLHDWRNSVREDFMQNINTFTEKMRIMLKGY
ncbi:uncharacterized protein LOC119677525 [Teleopsis dalmanni]|uniref:uncharacterized protein LOC119677525 n=1 Tax=Teleopsis dalmanni TaxID=139649 RepID=UPI0018CECFCB|nr:uncharacterized protein LOC119677525 [Teleopsis dalmanni]